MQKGTSEDFDFKKKWFEYIGYEPHEGQRLLHFPDIGKNHLHILVNPGCIDNPFFNSSCLILGVVLPSS